MQTFNLYGNRDNVNFGQTFGKDPRRNHSKEAMPFWLVLVDLLGAEKAVFFNKGLELTDKLCTLCEGTKKPLTYIAQSIHCRGSKVDSSTNGLMPYH